MKNLDELRCEIDKIDSAITDLYEKRIETAAEIGRFKLKNGLPVTDSDREAQILSQKAAMLKNPENTQGVRELFELLMRHGRNAQYGLEEEEKTEDEIVIIKEGWRRRSEPLAVCYQGEPGAYGEEAAVSFFGDGAGYKNALNFRDVFESIASGACDYGVLPVENNSTGAINDVYDLLGEYGFFIAGENIVKVRHCLLGTKDSEIDGIEEVYSHEQGFFQCEEFFKNYPGMKKIPYLNTAASAKFVAESGDKRRASVSSARAGEIYGLKVLKRDINTNPYNYTRFIIVSKTLELRERRDKISAVFRLGHMPGSLSRILSILALGGLNIYKIESRPVVDKGWEYTFFIDFEGDISDRRAGRCIDEMKGSSNYFRILGNYEMCKEGSTG